MRPGRRMRGSSEHRSRIVEGSGRDTGPASSTSRTRFPSCRATSVPERAPTLPERFALVPVSGHFPLRAKSRTSEERGKRTATVPVPADTASGTRAPAGSTKVKGPGQNRSASGANAAGSVPTMPDKASKESISNRIGLDSGRPLARNNLLTACGFKASARSPYSVSVGAATRAPRRIAAAARQTVSGAGRSHSTGIRSQNGTASYGIPIYGTLRRPSGAC